MKRTLATIAIFVVAGLIVLAWTLSQATDPPGPESEPQTSTEVAEDQPTVPQTPADLAAEAPEAPAVVEDESPADDTPELAETPTVDEAADAEEPADGEQADAADAPPAAVEAPDAPAAEPGPSRRVYRVQAAALGTQPEPIIGAPLLDTGEHPIRLQAKFSSLSAGLRSMHLAPYSTDPIDYEPYLLQSEVYWKPHERTGKPIHLYPMGSAHITIDGQQLRLTHANWNVVEDFPMPNEPGADQPQGTEVTFELFIVDDNDERVVRLTRRFWIEPELYNLYLDQRIENLTDRPLEIQYAQLGQGDLQAEVGYMGDMRRLAVGYYIPKYEPSIYTHDFEESRGNLIERGLSHKLWPTDGSQEAGYRMVWVGLVNRYFSATLHARTESIDDQIVVPVQPIEEVFPTVQSYAFGGEDDGRLILMYFTPPVELLPGSENALDVNVTLYGGPMSNEVLERPAYAGLHLEKQIRYKTGCCLSFDWLSKFLYRLLDFFHIVLRDWALAIMGLVVIIRLLLHPITKRSQLNMMKFSRQMSKLQPEIEKLKKKHKDDSAKLNQEMMQLYRERGVNPAAMAGGCLPMFLQTPIWIGLWAMLYFVFELRHEGAFFGVFQAISGGEWYFLADLSTDDNFIMLPEAARFSIPLLGYMDSINLIPFMLVLVFYLQQKFMQPPTAGPMSDQQKQQQKMMKWMIMLFPIMLYNAPSGLTLYMIASTGSGILDSMIVRKHLKELEERGELDKPKEKKPPKPGGIRDRIQKAAEAKRKQLEEMQKQQAKQQQQVSGGKRRSKRK